MDKKPTVLITGASSGIGYELSKVFAKNKYNLILVARDGEKLSEIAKQLKKDYDIEINIIVKDLSLTNSAKAIYDEVIRLSIKVDVLVNNAGVGAVGLFHKIEVEKDLEMLKLNIVTLTELTKLFLQHMVEAKEGKILNVASTGSFHPGPYTSVYYATKAYVLSFSEALSRELESYNITVTALCPGATRTNFAKRAGKRDFKGAMEAKIVAEVAYDGLIKNKRVVVPGFMNKILIRLPRGVVSKMVSIYQQSLLVK